MKPFRFLRAVLLAALLMLGGPSPVVADEAPPTVDVATPHTSQIRVSAYNACAAHCPWMKPWSWRAPRIVKRIAVTKPDVVIMVEAGGGARLRRLDRLMSKRGLHRKVGKAARFIYVRDGVTVLRTGVVSVRRTSQSKRVRLPWVEVSVGSGLPVTVVGIHLSATDSKAKDLDRLHEIKKVERVLRRHERVVMVGDFNGLSRRHRAEHDADRHRYRVHEHLKKHGWASATGGATYMRQPGDHRRLSLSFDRAYVRGVRVERLRVLSGGERLSDHRGVALTLCAGAET